MKVKHTPRFGSNFGRPGGDVALATLDAKRFTSWSAPKLCQSERVENDRYVLVLQFMLRGW